MIVKPARGIPLNKSHPLNRELTGLWLFNESTGNLAWDYSGNGNTGTITGAAWSGEKFGNALSFNGSSNYINCGDSSSLKPGLGDFSAFVWMKGTPPATWMGLIGDRFTYAMGSASGWAMSLSSGKNLAALVEDVTGNRKMYVGTVAFNDGIWHCLGFTWRSASQDLELFADGLPTPFTPGTVGIIGEVTVANNINIGRQPNGGYFTGLIDNVRIYKRCLSSVEIQWLYREPFADFN